MVELHVESELGAGTTFRVYIPVRVVKSGKIEATEHLPTASLSLPELHILVAEDDLSNQLVVRRMLEKNGHSITCVTTGREALTALEQETFDIILMDVQMPEVDGAEATEAIRAGEAGRNVVNIPIIALTAHAMSGDKERFLEAGMDDYLAKPIEADELAAVIGRVMEKRGRE